MTTLPYRIKEWTGKVETRGSQTERDVAGAWLIPAIVVLLQCWLITTWFWSKTTNRMPQSPRPLKDIWGLRPISSTTALARTNCMWELALSVTGRMEKYGHGSVRKAPPRYSKTLWCIQGNQSMSLCRRACTQLTVRWSARSVCEMGGRGKRDLTHFPVDTHPSAAAFVMAKLGSR